MPTATTVVPKWNTWYQIHTNGGNTVFARIFEGYNDLQRKCFWFEKMNVDHTHSSIEIFAEMEYNHAVNAQDRLAGALETAI